MARQTHGDVEYNIRLDMLTVGDVIWTPYTGHRVHCEFHESFLYSSYIWWEALVARHCLERCPRHYGYV